MWRRLVENLKGSGASLPSAVLSLDKKRRGKLAGFAGIMRPFKLWCVAATAPFSGTGADVRASLRVSGCVWMWWLTVSVSTRLIVGYTLLLIKQNLRAFLVRGSSFYHNYFLSLICYINTEGPEVRQNGNPVYSTVRTLFLNLKWIIVNLIWTQISP